MRWLAILAVAVLAFACTEHGKGGGKFCSFEGQTHQVGDQFPAADGCNFCECDIDGHVVCTNDTCNDGGVVIVDAPAVCNPSGTCVDGPECGGACCGLGEQCLGGMVCSCGGNAACAGGDTCQSGGPVGGGSFCGSVCCGGPNPCPI